MKLKNLNASNYSEITTIIAICGETDTARYHIWVDRDTLKPQDDILHKNPPLSQPNAFKHQPLRQAAQCNHEIVKQLLAAAPSTIAGAKFKAEKEKERTRLEYEESKRQERIKNAAPSLLSALELLYACFDDEGNLNEQFQDQVSVALETAEAAIKEAKK